MYTYERERQREYTCTFMYAYVHLWEKKKESTLANLCTPMRKGQRQREIIAEEVYVVTVSIERNNTQIKDITHL